jgi:superfamily I DNA/RNA helicase
MRSLLSTIHGAAIINESKQDINTKFNDVKFYTFFSYRDFFDAQLFDYYLKKIHLKYDSQFYPAEPYKEIRRHLMPSLHKLEEGKIFYPNTKQASLIISKEGDQRIKGVAGTGKTTVLAHKAVYSNERTKSEVLILSFNITIRHYIKYKIENVRKEFLRSDFHISHYHDFFKNQSIQFKNSKPIIVDWENVNYFEDVKNRLPKYKSIIIDETQDYNTKWVEILKKYFLQADGEFVIYFDENQDIYQRKNKGRYPMIGRPNELTKSYRLSKNISNLTKKFYNNFMENAEPFEIEVEANTFNFNEFRENISYKYFDKAVTDDILYNYIKSTITITNSSPDDIAIIGTTISKIREMEYYFRTIKSETTTRMFESKEEYDSILKDHPEGEKSQKFKMDLKTLRRQYKLHKFNLVTGNMKFSSIHSFKGWEIHTVFFIINEIENNDSAQVDEEDFINEQLIYTGITRARHNLNIINIGNTKYDSFFSHEIS